MMTALLAIMFLFDFRLNWNVRSIKNGQCCKIILFLLFLRPKDKLWRFVLRTISGWNAMNITNRFVYRDLYEESLEPLRIYHIAKFFRFIPISWGMTVYFCYQITIFIHRLYEKHTQINTQIKLPFNLWKWISDVFD